MDEQQKELGIIMSNYRYCLHLIRTGNRQHCLYIPAKVTVTAIDEVLDSLTSHERALIQMAFIEQLPAQIITKKLNYNRAEYYRLRHNAINVFMKLMQNCNQE